MPVTTIGPGLLRCLAGAMLVLGLANQHAACAVPPSLGLSELRLHDEQRLHWSAPGPRPLHTLLWYPAEAGLVAQPWQGLPFVLAPVARGAAPLAQQLPLVLLSHGTGGSAVAMGWLAEALAAQGYLVAAPNHHGNTAAEATYRPEAFLSWTDRPRDLTVLLDRLLASPDWGPHIDTRRIAVLGYSLGGYTALAAVGARLDRERLQAWWRDCAEASEACVLPPEIADRYGPSDLARLMAQSPRLQAHLAGAAGDWRDTRLRAAIAIAPVFGPLYQPISLQALSTPVLLIAADADDQAPPERTALPVHRAVSGSRLQRLPGATHYSFLSRCLSPVPPGLAAFCSDPPGMPREQVHAEVLRAVLAFLRQRLGP